MNFDILTIGDAFEDIFIEAKDIEVRREQDYLSGKSVSFELGEKIPLKDVAYEIGGSACNMAVGLSRLGLKTSILTVLGKDSPASNIVEKLRQEGVDQSNLKVISSIRSNFSVVFRVKDARTIFVYHSLEDYEEIRLKSSVRARWYFLAPIGEGTQNLENDLIAKVSEDKSFLAWNPGGVQIKKGASHFRHLLKCTSVLFMNREESVRFLNYPVKPTDEEVMKKLHLLGPKIVVITKGKEGAKAYDGHNIYKVDSFSNIQKVDATGAGDSFATGFVGCLLNAGWQGGEEDKAEIVSEALKWAIANSNSVLGYIGAQKGLLKKSEIKEVAEKRRFELAIR